MDGMEVFGWDTRSVDEMTEDEKREALWTGSGTPPCPVTARVRRFRQPRGGLLPLSMFDRADLGDPRPLHACESMPADLVGLCVDYLTRLTHGNDPRTVFSTPLLGTHLAGETARAEELLAGIHGVDDRSVRAAALLVDYDSAGRRGTVGWRPRRPLCGRCDGVEHQTDGRPFDQVRTGGRAGGVERVLVRRRRRGRGDWRQR